MTDLITSGQLLDLAPAPVQQQTLVIDTIRQYLVSDEKHYDQDILDWMILQFGKSVMKHLMRPRDLRKGHDSNSMYTGACARKAWHQFNGTTGEPMQERQALKFIMGDGVEIMIYGAARLAG